MGDATDVFNQSLASPKEVELVGEMLSKLTKQEMEDAGPEVSDPTFGLLRFLRGYAGNVEEAVGAFRAAAKWRAKFGGTAKFRERLLVRNAGDMTEEQVFEAYADLSRLPHYDKVAGPYLERAFHGRDSAGNPIMITQQDMIADLSGLMSSVTPTEFDEWRFGRWINLELLLFELSKRRQRLVKTTYLWDLTGMGKRLWQQWHDPVVSMFSGDFDQEASNAFPETTLRIVPINVPGWMMVLWTALVRNVIPARTLKKILVLGTRGVADQLVAQCGIPVMEIPATLGGSCPAQVTESRLARPPCVWKSEELSVPPRETRSFDVVVQKDSVVLWSVWNTSSLGRPVTVTAFRAEPGKPDDFADWSGVVQVEGASLYSSATRSAVLTGPPARRPTLGADAPPPSVLGELVKAGTTLRVAVENPATSGAFFGMIGGSRTSVVTVGMRPV